MADLAVLQVVQLFPLCWSLLSAPNTAAFVRAPSPPHELARPSSVCPQAGPCPSTLHVSGGHGLAPSAERLAPSPGQSPPPTQGLRVFPPRTSSPTPSHPGLLPFGLSPLWRPYSSSSSCEFRRPGSAPCRGVPAASPAPGMLQEMPCCASLPLEFGETRFTLPSPGPAPHRELLSRIPSVSGRRVWLAPSGQMSPSAPAVRLPLAAGRWGQPCIRVFPPPATLPRGGNSWEEPPGGAGRGGVLSGCQKEKMKVDTHLEQVKSCAASGSFSINQIPALLVSLPRRSSHASGPLLTGPCAWSRRLACGSESLSARSLSGLQGPWVTK